MRNVGNEYQGKTLVGAFDINIVATQYTDETDGFNDIYDGNAEFEVIVAKGVEGGVDWKLSESGKLTISNAVDADGSWREAVVYDAKGNPVAIGGYPYDVNAVTEIVIEEGVTSIGSFTSKFPNVTGEVVIPASVTYIGQEAFQNVPITKLTFAPGGTEPLCIAPGAFKGLNVTEIVLPADRPQIHIHCWAFNLCKKLETITFPANITTFTGWTHVDYCGMDYVEGSYRTASDILSKCSSLKKIIFGSQEVHDLFFNANSNRGTVNAIGGVEIVIE